MYDLVASTKKVYSTPYPYLWVREGGGKEEIVMLVAKLTLVCYWSICSVKWRYAATKEKGGSSSCMFMLLCDANMLQVHTFSTNKLKQTFSPLFYLPLSQSICVSDDVHHVV